MKPMHTCSRCGRPLRSPNAWHYCVRVDLDALFADKHPELEYVFDKLLLELYEWGELNFSATKAAIVFVNQRRSWLIIRPLKKALDLKFYLPEAHDKFPVVKTRYDRSKWEHHIRLQQVEDVDEQVLQLLRQAYAF